MTESEYLALPEREKDALSHPQRAVVRKLELGHKLRSDHWSRCDLLYWITPGGRCRQRGPGWHTVQALERRGILVIHEITYVGTEELHVELAALKARGVVE